MAGTLQVLLEKQAVTAGGEQYKGKVFTGSCRLRCWAEGASAPDDPTVIDRIISATYRDVGLGVDEQIFRWGKKIKQQAQQIIDDYKLEQLLLTNEKLADAVAAIQGQLEG